MRETEILTERMPSGAGEISSLGTMTNDYGGIMELAITGSNWSEGSKGSCERWRPCRVGVLRKRVAMESVGIKVVIESYGRWFILVQM